VPVDGLQNAGLLRREVRRREVRGLPREGELLRPADEMSGLWENGQMLRRDVQVQVRRGPAGRGLQDQVPGLRQGIGVFRVFAHDGRRAEVPVRQTDDLPLRQVHQKHLSGERIGIYRAGVDGCFLRRAVTAYVRARRIRRGVIGVLIRRREFLVVRRSDRVAKGGRWCFPGGHLEPGENSAQAVQRELREELGIEVRPIRRMGSIRVLDTGHLLVVWQVRRLRGRIRPAPAEIAEFQWLTADRLRRLDGGLPSNEAVLRMFGR
jgi:8-oxo-dGTP diphosphatase